MPEETVSTDQRSTGIEPSLLEGDVRPQVETLFHDLWGEYALAIHLQEYDPKYYVDGLRRNGSRKGERVIPWLIGRLLSPIGYVLSDHYVDAPSTGLSTLGNGKVVGPAQKTRAVRLATSIGTGDKWVAWSANHVALFDYDDAQRLGVRWHASTPDLPTYQRKETRVTLTWPDASYILFLLQAGERWRLDALDRGDPDWQNINNRHR